MDATIRIQKMQLLTGSGADILLLRVSNWTNGTFPFNGGQELKLTLAAGTGLSWVLNNLGSEYVDAVDVVDT